VSARAGYRVELEPGARRQLAKLAPPIRDRVSAVIAALGTDPRPPGTAALVGTTALRARAGDYRVVYRVDDDARLVEVLRVAHRREVYRR